MRELPPEPVVTTPDGYVIVSVDAADGSTRLEMAPEVGRECVCVLSQDGGRRKVLEVDGGLVRLSGHGRHMVMPLGIFNAAWKVV
jgi:hypothetical protein